MNRRYEILDVLGSGGMATVWRARDTELDRIVAIKRPHPAPSGSAVHERFRREARAAAMVSHPNLVTVHDVGSDDDGPYLVMEFVDAGSLSEVEWTRERARAIGIDIAAALAALHAAGIVHRDVKPANILVPEGGAMLTDFGIARAGGDATLTQEGTTFATPAYAAPEVIARGEHSPASDVYALGAVLREMILGRRVAPTTDTQVLVTDDLWAPVLAAAMSEQPDERPSAAGFAAALRALPAAAGLAPTTPMHVGREATTRTASTPDDDRRSAGRSELLGGGRSWLPALVVGITAFLIAALLVVAVRRAVTDDDVADSAATTPAPVVTAVPTTVATATVPTTVAATTVPPTTELPTTPPPTTLPPTSVPPTAEAAPAESVDDLRSDLAVFVSDLPDDVLTSKEAERLIEDVDKAIEDAAADDIEGATEEIDDALERIEKRVDDTATAEQATALVRRIASALGVSLD